MRAKTSAAWHRYLRAAQRGPLGVLFAVAALVITPAFAIAAPEPERYTQASLISEHAAVSPGGSTTLGVHFKIHKGWHIYWQGLNDTGFPVDLNWSADGIAFGKAQWPVPKRYIAPGDILDYVYEKEVTLLTEITVPADAKPGSTITIDLEAVWLVCKEACLPEDAMLSISLPIVAVGTEPARTADAARIDAARARLPLMPSTDPALFDASWQGETLTILPRGTFRWAAFYPHADSLAVERPIERGLVKSGDGPLRLEIDRSAPGDATRLVGMLEIDPGGGEPSRVLWIDRKPGD